MELRAKPFKLMISRGAYLWNCVKAVPIAGQRSRNFLDLWSKALSTVSRAAKNFGIGNKATRAFGIH
jgi:hypothetical protein